MATSTVPSRKLNSGYDIPLVSNSKLLVMQCVDISQIGYGTGTALFKRENLDSIERETVDFVKTAITVGKLHRLHLGMARPLECYLQCIVLITYPPTLLLRGFARISLKQEVGSIVGDGNASGSPRDHKRSDSNLITGS